jgi:c-di-GMP-binding flagellar brake protein YcgR
MGIQTHVLFARHVKVLDISITGIAFEVPGKLKIHAPYTLKLKNSVESISLKGFVARSAVTGYKVHSSGRKIPVYTVGFEFADLTPEHIDKVIKFINGYSRKDYTFEQLSQLSGSRLCERFPIHTSGKDTVEFVEEYAVKNLSSGGMFLEGDYAVKTSTKIRMEIMIPHHNPINIVGKIVRCFMSKDNEPKRFRLGVEILEMSEQNKKLLGEMVNAINDLFSNN